MHPKGKKATESYAEANEARSWGSFDESADKRGHESYQRHAIEHRKLAFGERPCDKAAANKQCYQSSRDRPRKRSAVQKVPATEREQATEDEAAKEHLEILHPVINGRKHYHDYDNQNHPSGQIRMPSRHEYPARVGEGQPKCSRDIEGYPEKPCS